MLTFRLEKEPAIVTPPTIRYDITDTRTAVLNSQNSVLSPGATAPGTLKGPEDMRGQVWMVRNIRVLLVTE